MNTNFPFRSNHQHVKLHFVSFFLSLLLFFLIPKCFHCHIFYGLSAYSYGTYLYQKFQNQSLTSNWWCKDLPWNLSIYLKSQNPVKSCGWQGLFSRVAFFLFRPICGRTTTRRWWHGWRSSSLKKRAHDPLSTRTSNTSAEITSSSRYAGDLSQHVVYSETNCSSRNLPAPDDLFYFSFCSYCSLVQANPEVAMDSIVHMTQHISPTQRTEVVRILSTMETSASS